MRNTKMLAFLLAAGLTASFEIAGKSVKLKQSDDTHVFSRELSKDRQVLHVLDRLCFGPRPGDVEIVRRIGAKKWIDQQLHPERVREDPVLDEKLKPLESLRMTPAETALMVDKYRAKKSGQAQAAGDLEVRTKLSEILSPAKVQILKKGSPEQKRDLIRSLSPSGLDDLIVALPRSERRQLLNFVPAEARRKVMLLSNPQAVLSYDLSEAKLTRAIYSRRQLQEQLVDFWYNHFNVFLDKGADRYLVPAYERDAIRPYVLGHFRDLLAATAHSPAMLFYLDNWQSVAPRPAGPKGRPRRGLNENYARELMELHTLGVDGGYTQQDVIEVARCFTGWTIETPQKGGEFKYNDKVHDKGAKVVLGVAIPAGGGMEDGERVLDILSHQPATAHFISRQLAIRFVADNPPPALVERMAHTFHKSGGDLRAVMKSMLESKEFMSEGAYRSKVKTPFEMVVSAVRAMNADVEFAFPLANQVAQLGQPLYRKIEPTGYSSANADWVNSAALLGRMNFALALVENRIAGVTVDTSHLSNDRAKVAGAVLFQDVSAATEAALEKALAGAARPFTPALLAGLVLGSPDFQRR